MGVLAWAMLLASAMTAMGEPKPGVLEVDLLFPRNETYAPNPLMPIVFALQNPTLASVNGLIATVYWELWEGNNRTSAGSITKGYIDLTQGENLTFSDPYLISRSINTVAYPEGFWTFAWSLRFFNCTETVEGQPQARNGFTTLNAKPTVFTISKSGQATDLTAATSAGKCNAAESFAFNVTAWGYQCGVLGPSPTADPCAAKIDSAAASSISAAATDSACSFIQRPLHPNVTCPAPTSASTANPRMAVASTLLALLATLTTLVHLG